MIRFVTNTQLKQLLHPTYLAHTWIYSYVVQCTCIGLIWLTYDLCGNVLVFLLDFLYREKSSAFKILKTLWRVRNCFTHIHQIQPATQTCWPVTCSNETVLIYKDYIKKKKTFILDISKISSLYLLGHNIMYANNGLCVATFLICGGLVSRDHSCSFCSFCRFNIKSSLVLLI